LKTGVKIMPHKFQKQHSSQELRDAGKSANRKASRLITKLGGRGKKKARRDAKG